MKDEASIGPHDAAMDFLARNANATPLINPPPPTEQHGFSIEWVDLICQFETDGGLPGMTAVIIWGYPGTACLQCKSQPFGFCTA